MIGQALVEVAQLVKLHDTADGTVRAVDGVSLVVRQGEVLGLVGESGCGKSTLGRAILALERPSAGAVRFAGQDLAKLGSGALRRLRRDMQIVFQDPFGSLNPRSTVERILSEPFAVHGMGSRAERRGWVQELLRKVGLRPEHAGRFPHEFSGGQRQRISIARAIALKPKFIVCDEAVSALDVSIQAQILNLLQELRMSEALTYLFISHDLGVVGRIADRIAVMYLGQIVELGSARGVARRPRHPYTQALFAAVPTVRGRREKSAAIASEPPSPYAMPSGCRFHTRCPIAVERCRIEQPRLREVAPGQEAACHLA
ncbi:MAG: oligopeptide/dipeptide ABC transporter ATP-binding protein [Rhodospirillales bacterium]